MFFVTPRSISELYLVNAAMSSSPTTFFALKKSPLINPFTLPFKPISVCPNLLVFVLNIVLKSKCIAELHLKITDFYGIINKKIKGEIPYEAFLLL